MGYKVVIFDMGGVLIGNNADPRRSVSATLQEILQRADDDFLAAQYAAETGQTSLVQYLPLLLEAASKLPSKPDLEMFRHWDKAGMFDGTRDKMNKFMIEAILKIREKGYKTAVLTNNFWVDDEKTVSTLPVDNSLFDVIIESCRVGLAKPDKRIYELALQKLDCKASEAIFLDDFAQNVKGAQELGIKTIHVTNQEKAASELLQLLNID